MRAAFAHVDAHGGQGEARKPPELAAGRLAPRLVQLGTRMSASENQLTLTRATPMKERRVKKEIPISLTVMRTGWALIFAFWAGPVLSAGAARIYDNSVHDQSTRFSRASASIPSGSVLSCPWFSEPAGDVVSREENAAQPSRNPETRTP